MLLRQHILLTIFLPNQLVFGNSGNEQLFEAIQNGNVAQVSAAVAAGANVNQPDENGNTPLIVAVKQQKVQIVELLLQRQADPSLTDDNGLAPLHWVALLGYADVGLALLRNRADANIESSDDNQTPLMKCLKAPGCTGQIVVALLNNSASVDLVDAEGESALDMAKTTPKIQLYVAFIAGCLVNQNEDCVAVLLENDQLLRRGVDFLNRPVPGFQRPEDTLLSLALRYNVMVEVLLEAGANPDQPSYNMALAVRSGQLAMVRLLLSYGANLNAKSVPDCSMTPVMICSQADGSTNLCTLEIFNFLLDRQVSLSETNCRGEGLYHIARANRNQRAFFDKLDSEFEFLNGAVQGSTTARSTRTTRSQTVPSQTTQRSAPMWPCGYDGVRTTTPVPTTTTTLRPGRRGSKPADAINRVTRGTEAWFPWMARLRVSFDGQRPAYCGASIITANWLLTAAHCLVNPSKFIRGVDIQMGNHNFSQIEPGQPEPQPPRQQVIHPLYNSETMDYDFALLKLNYPISRFTEKIQPICLPDHPEEMCDDEIDVGDETLNQVDSCRKVISAGWGLNEEAKLTPALQKVELAVQSYTSCEDELQVEMDDVRICAGSQTGQDTCQGDSGGPLMCVKNGRYYVIGVVSYGKEDCGDVGIPGVYSRVCKILPWIKNVTSFDFRDGTANDYPVRGSQQTRG